jgi:DNA-binding NtrC family response regulator
LGSTEATAVDVRLVSGGQENLHVLVRLGRFRADLRARLEGFVVEVPPLRHRREEIPGLLFHFAEVYGGATAPRFDADLLERACLLEWPANVRELELLVRKLVAVYPNEAVLRLELAEPFLNNQGSAGTSKASERPAAAPPGTASRQAYELNRLNGALREHAGNMKAAAATAGISRRRAYRLLENAPTVAGDERAEPSGSANQKR